MQLSLPEIITMEEAMTVTFQDLLQAICTKVSLTNTNDSHYIFSLDTPKEAQLAYDVLAAYGFDIRVYHEEATSKLYIARNTGETADSANKLAAARNHATMLKEILEFMHNSDQSDYKISFVNTPSLGKQISIYFPPATNAMVSSAAPVPSTIAHANNNPQLQQARAKQTLQKKNKNLLHAGPQLAKNLPFSAKAAEQSGEIGLKKWLANYFLSNFTQSFYASMIMLFFAILVLSMLVVAKGFMCPDLATIKSREWYCQ
jgi:hypothetical protein